MLNKFYSVSYSFNTLIDTSTVLEFTVKANINSNDASNKRSTNSNHTANKRSVKKHTANTNQTAKKRSLKLNSNHTAHNTANNP